MARVKASRCRPTASHHRAATNKSPQQQPAIGRATTHRRQAASAPNSVAERLASLGMDTICSAIVDGKTLTAIAEEAGVAVSKVVEWLAADPERSARAREARTRSAAIWDEKAEAAIQAARDHLELQKARELAHHYRWRASKIAPAQYGEKVTVGGAGDLPPIRQDASLGLSAVDAYLQMMRLGK